MPWKTTINHDPNADYYQITTFSSSDKVGLYWKAVVEEFCELPDSEREEVYQIEYWSSILSAIARKKRLKLVLRSTYQTPARNANICYFKPLSILQDSGSPDKTGGGTVSSHSAPQANVYGQKSGK